MLLARGAIACMHHQGLPLLPQRNSYCCIGLKRLYLHKLQRHMLVFFMLLGISR